MGIGCPALSLMSLMNEDKLFAGMTSVVELGAQEINSHFTSMAHDFPFKKAINNRPLKSNETYENITVPMLYKRLGFTQYESIDANGIYGSQVFDLNTDIFAETNFNKQYDLVTNFGTSEHCFDQNMVFRNSHNLCKKNGLMIGIIPFQGYVNHGFISYNPLFFQELAIANGYDLVGLYWNFVTTDFYPRAVLPYDDEMVKAIQEQVAKKEIAYGPHSSYEEICYVMRKKNDEPYKTPYQGRWLGESKVKDNYGRSNLDNSFTLRKTFDPNEKNSKNILDLYMLLYNNSLRNRWRRFNQLSFSGKIMKIAHSLKVRMGMSPA